MANAPLSLLPHEGVPEVLLLSNGFCEDSCDGNYGEMDISSKAKEVRHYSCEQLAYNR